MTLREARLEDTPALVGLAGELGYRVTPSEIDARLRAREPEREAWIVAQDDAGRAVGFAHVAHLSSPIEGPGALLGALVVAAAERRTGLGRLLVAAAEGWARERGLAFVRLGSRESRTEAHAFYRSLGYEELKTQRIFGKRL